MGRKAIDANNKLVIWLESRGMTQREFAGMIDTHVTYVSRLCRRQLVPSLELAFSIEDATRGKVPARYWLNIHEERTMPNGYKEAG